MNVNEKQAYERLCSKGRSKDHVRRAAWMALSVALVLIVLLSVAIMDYWLQLPMGLRLGGFIAVGGLIALGTVQILRLLLKPTPIKEVALDYEKNDVSLGTMVSTAAEYISGQRKITQEYEPELVAALESEAAKALQRSQLTYRKQLTLPFGLLAGALVVMAGFYLFSSGALTAFARAAAPWSKATYTRVEVKPGDIEIPVGRNVSIECVFTGRAVKDPKFQWREFTETAWHQVGIKTNATGSFVHVAAAVQKPFFYRVTGGDAVSPEYRVEPYVPPQVKTLGIRLEYPAYTERQAIEQQTPNISILRASKAAFNIEPNVPLKSARLVFENMPAVSLSKRSNDFWTCGFAIKTNTDYWIELVDERNHVGTNMLPYKIKSLPDEPPKVEVREPGQDVRAELNSAVPIKVSAADDYGIAEMKIVYHKLGGKEQTLKLNPSRQKNGEIVASGSLNLADLGMKEYEVIAYHAEAVDNNTLDGPGIGKSQVYFIETTSIENRSMPSQKQGNMQKVNLLAIQKQIISDTKAVAQNSSKDTYKELAEREKIASEFGDTYLETMSAMGAPPEAAQKMSAAVQSMKNATQSLENKDRESALPAEEKALADLYQVLKMMPQLQNLPVQAQQQQQQQQQQQNPMLSVVLEAIKKKNEQQQNNQELSEITDKIEQLSEQQSGLTEALSKLANLRRPEGQEPSANDASNPQKNNAASQQNGESQQSEQAGQQGQGDSKDQKGSQGKKKDGDQKSQRSQSGKSQNDQKGKSKGQGKSDDQQAQNEGNQNGKGDQPSEQQGQQQGQGQGQGQNAGNPQDLAKKEEQLSEEAKTLAEKLSKLAGKDTRLGNNLTKTMNQAANQMESASKSLKGGQPGKGFSEAQEGGYGLNTVVSMLQKVLEMEKQLSDTSSEEYPKEYETAIKEYLKRLSYQE